MFVALDSFFPCGNLLIYGVLIIQVNRNGEASSIEKRPFYYFSFLKV